MSTYLCQTLICYFSHITYVCLYSRIDSESEELLKFSPSSGVYILFLLGSFFLQLQNLLNKKWRNPLTWNLVLNLYESTTVRAKLHHMYCTSNNGLCYDENMENYKLFENLMTIISLGYLWRWAFYRLYCYAVFFYSL